MNKARFIFSLIILMTGLVFAYSVRAEQRTLDIIKARGMVHCGVSHGLPGFASPDDKGDWSGLDVDLCRAIAAAIFDDAERVRFTPLSAKERFTALQSGEIDVLARNTTWTMQRDTALGLDFVAVNYYDGQAFMVPRAYGIKTVSELDGATLCGNQGTTTELNAADYFRTHGMAYEMVTYEKSDEAIAAYAAGRCDAYTTDVSGLYAERLKLPNAHEHMILPEIISKEPLGPAVRHGDNQWGDIVRWTHNAMLIAEELDVTQQNIMAMRRSPNPAIQRLLGVNGAFGENIGLTRDWASRIIRHVGNYGESFERNVGQNSRLGIARGLNALWTKGGLHYAPPIR